MYKNSLVVFILCFSLSSYSQDEIVTFPDYFTLRLGVSESYNSFEIYDKFEGNRFLISPNQKIITTLSFLFRSVEIDLGFAPSFLNSNDDDVKGKTKLFALNLRSYLGNWMQSFDFYNTKGFYIANGSLDISEGETITLPNLKVFKIGGSTSYVFNDKFFIQGNFVPE